MPQLTTHLGLAYQIAPKLSGVKGHLDVFLLGATAPDIRVLTGQSRESTHFSSLSSADPLAGIHGMATAYPNLLDGSRLNPPTRCFIAGYLSHLIADQAWINMIYRPYFGNPELFFDRIEANVLDRALQLELDRETREKLNNLDNIRYLLENWETPVSIDFISTPTLIEWRQRLLSSLNRGFSWDHLRNFVRRQNPEDGKVASQITERFLEDIPVGLKNIHRKLPKEQVVEFRQKTIQTVIEYLEEYLA